ncbi:hypothetical protein V5J36_000742 [Endozoicomonas sp. NE41]
MADVTVEQLAKVVGAPVDRLLKQMKDAGLKHTQSSQSVSDAEKQQLLAHLKATHGDHTGGAEPTKITLKRKTVSQMKVAGGSAGKNKVVNVEVRKKRTYVKREEEEKKDEGRGQRREGDSRGPRREGDSRGPRREGDSRGPRREGDSRGPRREGDSRGPRREGDSRGPRREGDSRGPRREGDSRGPRREGDNRGPRREGDNRGPRREGDNRGPRGPSAPRFDPAAAPPPPPSDDNKRSRSRKGKDRRDNERDDRRDGDRRGRGGRGGRDDRRGGRRQHRTVAPESMAAHGFTKPTAPVVREVSIPETITVAELAQKMAVKAADVIKAMFKMGSMVTINQVIDQDTASIVVEEMGHSYKLTKADDIEDTLVEDQVDGQSGFEEKPRAPVVTVMGHVDHGKNLSAGLHPQEPCTGWRSWWYYPAHRCVPRRHSARHGVLPGYSGTRGIYPDACSWCQGY